MEILLSHDTKSTASDREVKLNDEVLMLKEEVEVLKGKLEQAKQGIAPSEDATKMKALEVEVAKRRTEAQKVKELEEVVEHMKKERDEREVLFSSYIQS